QPAETVRQRLDRLPGTGDGRIEELQVAPRLRYRVGEHRGTGQLARELRLSQPSAAEAAAGEAGEEALERRGQLLDVTHAVVARLAEFGARGGIVDRVLQAAEGVDQPALLRLGAAPHAAARHLVDLRDRPLARLG